jgi:hypothetical protein
MGCECSGTVHSVESLDVDSRGIIVERENIIMFQQDQQKRRRPELVEMPIRFGENKRWQQCRDAVVDV